MARDATIEILDQVGKPSSPNSYTTGRGVELRLKRVSSLILQDALKKLVPPKPPKVYLEDKQTHEENPNDPDFIAAQQAFDMERGMLSMGIYFTLGTEVVSTPPDVPHHSSEDWVEDIEFIAGIPVPSVAEKPRARYLLWLKYIAITDDDLEPLLQKIMRMSGLTMEGDVAQATQAFRNSPARDSDSGVPYTEEGERGNHLSVVPSVSGT